MKRFYLAVMGRLRRLYDWVLHWADTPHGTWALAALAFAESSFFPIPPDVLLIALCLGARGRCFRFALVTSIASVLGGLFGYGIGALAYQSLGAPIIDFYGAEAKYAQIQSLYQNHGFAVVFLAGFTPIPFKVITIAAGVFELELIPFTLASLIGRSSRFFLVAGCIWLFGDPVKRFIDRWFNLLTLLFGVLLVGGFVVLRLVGK